MFGGKYKFSSFFQKFCFVFHHLYVKWKILQARNLKKQLEYLKISLRIMIKEVWVYKSALHEWRLLHNLVSIFQVEYRSPEKNQENNIEYLQQHSSNFHQIFTEIIALYLLF